MDWNPQIYGQFLDMRSRPVCALLASLPPDFVPQRAVDLGCGPGNSTILIHERWPKCRLVGLDSSPQMLIEARRLYPNISFCEGNIADFRASEPPDLLFANASLQWLPQHETLFPRLIDQLAPQGFFAIQMPNNFHAATHQTIVQLLMSHKTWKPLLTQLRYGLLQKPLYQVGLYYDLLTQHGLQGVQIWETEYVLEMNDHSDIFAWVQGTGLRPIFEHMDTSARELFAQEYVAAITEAYPRAVNGKVLMVFRRLFVVGKKPK